MAPAVAEATGILIFPFVTVLPLRPPRVPALVSCSSFFHPRLLPRRSCLLVPTHRSLIRSCSVSCSRVDLWSDLIPFLADSTKKVHLCMACRRRCGAFEPRRAAVLCSSSHSLDHYFESGNKNRQAYEVFTGNLFQSIALITVADALVGQLRDAALVIVTTTAGALSSHFLPELLENTPNFFSVPNYVSFLQEAGSRKTDITQLTSGFDDFWLLLDHCRTVPVFALLKQEFQLGGDSLAVVAVTPRWCATNYSTSIRHVPYCGNRRQIHFS